MNLPESGEGPLIFLRSQPSSSHHSCAQIHSTLHKADEAPVFVLQGEQVVVVVSDMGQ